MLQLFPKQRDNVFDAYVQRVGRKYQSSPAVLMSRVRHLMQSSFNHVKPYMNRYTTSMGLMFDWRGWAGLYWRALPLTTLTLIVPTYLERGFIILDWRDWAGLYWRALPLTTLTLIVPTYLDLVLQ
jgi:hypothetical protein